MEKCQAKAAENKARRKEHRVRVKEQTEQCQQLHLRLQVQCTLESLLMLGLQLNKCETGPYFFQNFQFTTIFISVFCKSCEPMLCEPEIVQKFCS